MFWAWVGFEQGKCSLALSSVVLDMLSLQIYRALDQAQLMLLHWRHFEGS